MIRHRLRLGIELRESRFQNGGIIIRAPDQRAIAVRTNGALGKYGRSFTGSKAAGLALEPVRDAVLDCLGGNVEPDREIQRCVMP